MPPSGGIVAFRAVPKEVYTTPVAGRAKALRLPAGEDSAEEKKQTRRGPPDAFKPQHEDKSERAFAVPPRRQYSATPFALPL